MRRPKKDIQLTSYDELLGLEETSEKSMNQVVEIELEKLYPFKNHPFHVNDDEKMAETVESIKTYGVLTPALVRPRPDGGYEMISGHRRKRGCELCGKTTLPALVRNYTDDEAVIIMVDSNIQRENLLPSEKAHAYKMKYDAMKHQGSKGEKYTADMVGEAAGDSGRTVQRYIRLAALSDALLDYVDNNKIPMIVGEKLSYLKPEEQEWLLEVITNSSIFPTKQQAEQLKECSANGKLNQSYIYAILRFQKRKAGGVAACERHNERKKEAYKSNPDIDMERSKNNYHLVAPPKYTYKKEINRKVAEAGCRTRKDSVMMVETLITASPEFMNQLPPEEQKAYFTMALDFISERVGEQNILSAVVHMDERTPHMHLCFVPITPDNKLSAKTILGNQKSLSEWQTAYHERMSSRWNQLERGQSSMETKRKHVPTWLYKLGGRLDKQYGEIVSALSDINAFNAGKKRDKALELVAAWLPEVEKFSKEIGRQQAYIDSLKEQIGQEADYAGRMRDEKYEQELKVQKANQRIFELQRTNEQMGRLLSKIPPEVLEELQRTGRNKSRER